VGGISCCVVNTHNDVDGSTRMRMSSPLSFRLASSLDNNHRYRYESHLQWRVAIMEMDKWFGLFG